MLPALRLAAHALKGSVQYSGPTGTLELAAQLERLGQDGDLTAAADRIVALEAEMAQFTDNLTQHNLIRSTTMPRTAIDGLMEILLVEDNMEDARVTIEALQQKNVRCQVQLVCDGEEALDFYTRRAFLPSAPSRPYPAGHGVA